MSNSNVDRCGITQAVRQGTNRGKGKNAQEKGRCKERKSKGKPKKTTAKMQKRKKKIWTFAQDSLYLQPNLENFIENYLILTLIIN